MTLRVTFLGTSAAIPTTSRNPSGVFINREGDRLLFDVGEGTQRQMMKYGTGFDVSDVFLTHLHGDHVLGLAGLLQTWEFTDRSRRLRIHTPVRTRARLEKFLFSLEGRPSYPVEIREVEPQEAALEADEYDVRVIETHHNARSVGYSLVEHDRRGRFDRRRAEELGVPVGPKFSQLHAGEPVELADGSVVLPEQVVGPPRPGRTVVYTGDTKATQSVVRAANEADLLIHDATFTSDQRERADTTAHATAKDAGSVASNAGARRLALTHISSRYPGAAVGHREEAEAVYDGDVVVAQDGLELDISFPEAES